MIIFSKKTLTINGVEKTFDYLIRTIHVEEKMIIVLLEIPYESDDIDNIYAVSYDGKILWRSESLREIYPEQINLPYENMQVEGLEIQAIDFYGRRFFIDIANGKILKRDIVK